MYTDTQSHVAPSLFMLSNALNTAGAGINPNTVANGLCDALLDHTLECAICLSSWDSQCSEYRKLQQQINAVGGATEGVMLAI